MGLRETVNQNPAITTGATLLIIVLAIIAIVWQLNSAPADAPGREKSRAPSTVRSERASDESHGGHGS